MSPDYQTSSEYLQDIVYSFSFHILKEEGKIPMTEQLEGFSNVLGVFIVRIVFVFVFN